MKVMFAGLGSIGQRHLRNLLSVYVGDLELIAYRKTRSVPVLDSSMKVVPGQDIATQHNIREFDSLDDALAEKPDCVFVTNPNSLHMEVTIAAAKAGAHVFVEKPLANDLDRLDELREVCAANDRVVFVGYQFRFHPGTIAAKKWLEEKRIGRVVKAHFENGEYLPGWHPYEDYRGGYAARADLGGGALLTQIHDFDLAYWLFGMPQSVFAVGGQLTSLEVDVEDSVTTLMSVPGEHGAFPVSIGQDYVRRPAARRFSVTGDEGVMEFDFHKQSASCIISGGEELRMDWSDYERNDMFIDEMKAFLAAMSGDKTNLIDLDEGVASLRIALAAKRSLGNGKAEAP